MYEDVLGRAGRTRRRRGGEWAIQSTESTESRENDPGLPPFLVVIPVRCCSNVRMIQSHAGLPIEHGRYLVLLGAKNRQRGSRTFRSEWRTGAALERSHGITNAESTHA